MCDKPSPPIVGLKESLEDDRSVMSGVVNQRRFRVCRDEQFASRFDVTAVVAEDFLRNARAF